MGSKRERRPGYWELRVYAGFEAGKRVYVSRTFEGPERAAVKALARLETELADRAVPTPGQGSLGELLETWWTTKDWRSARSRMQARDSLDRYVLPNLGAVHLARLTHDHIDRFYRALLDGRLAKRGKPLAGATVRRIHADLHAALAWGVMKGRLGVNPATRASAPAQPPTTVRAPERDEIHRLIAGARPPEFSVFLDLEAATGRRRGDLLGLQIPDVIWDEGAVVFGRRAVLADGKVLIEELDKNRRSVRLAVDASTMERLREHVSAMERRTMALGAHLGRRPFLFSDEEDLSLPWRPDSTSRRFRLLAERLGLPDLNLHGLRHAHVTELLSSGVDIETVAARVGDDPNTILRVYSHFRPAADRKAADVWGDLMGTSAQVLPIRASTEGPS